MLKALPLANAYRVTPTGLYLISTAYQGKRNVQLPFRALVLGDDPPLLPIGIQDQNFTTSTHSPSIASRPSAKR